jgi:hypothetical protein
MLLVLAMLDVALIPVCFTFPSNQRKYQYPAIPTPPPTYRPPAPSYSPTYPQYYNQVRSTSQTYQDRSKNAKLAYGPITSPPKYQYPGLQQTSLQSINILDISPLVLRSINILDISQLVLQSINILNLSPLLLRSIKSVPSQCHQLKCVVQMKFLTELNEIIFVSARLVTLDWTVPPPVLTMTSVEPLQACVAHMLCVPTQGGATLALASLATQATLLILTALLTASTVLRCVECMQSAGMVVSATLVCAILGMESITLPRAVQMWTSVNYSQTFVVQMPNV